MSHNIAKQKYFKRETASTSNARRLKEGNRNVRKEKDRRTESQEEVKKKAGAKRKRAELRKTWKVTGGETVER